MGQAPSDRPAAAGGNREGFRGDVEGLRAIAVLAVIAYHYSLGPFHGGYVGVDVFFVISGFVISRTLLRERERTGGTSLVDFYARRARRILPAAALTLVGTTLAAYLILDPATALRTAHDAVASTLFYANVHFAQQADNYLLAGQPASPLLHFWSLSIEEQFYFVWPSLFALAVIIGRRHRRLALGTLLVVLIGLSFTYSGLATAAHPLATYYSSFARAGELALGGLVAVAEPLCRRLPTRIGAPVALAGLGGIVATAVTFGAHTSYPGLAVAGPTLATAAVIAGGTNTSRGWAGRVLSTRPLRAVGALSYSLYLWHWPVYALAAERLGHRPSPVARVGLLAIAAVIAVASYTVVENPVRRRAAWVRARRVSLALGGGLVATSLVVATVVGAALTSVGTAPTPHPVGLVSLGRDLARAESQSALSSLVVPLSELPGDVAYNGHDRGCLVSFSAPTAMGDRPSDCVFGDEQSHRTVVLLGDSNADMWLPALDALGRREHLRVVFLARASCQMADLHLWNPALHRPGTACTAFRRDAVAMIARLHPLGIIVDDYEYGLRWNDQDHLVPTSTVLGATAATVAQLSRDGPVVWLGPPPPLMSDPSRCLSAHAHQVAACDSPVQCLSPTLQALAACRFAPSTGRTYAFVDALARTVRGAGGHYVDVAPLFCTSTRCPLVVDHIVTSSDLRHVSDHYATFVAPALGELLARGGIPVL